MRKQFLLSGLFVLAFTLLEATASAQGGAQAEIVVPRFSVFGGSMSVSVPDRGGTSLGGFHGGSDTRNEFGPGWGRGFSGHRTASDSGVRVWIHDFSELEPKVASGDGGDASATGGFAGRIRQYATATTSKGKSDESAVASKPSRDNTATFNEQHAADLLKRGRDAEAQGKVKIASFYYKAVAALSNTSSAPIARERLRVIEQKLAGP